VPGLAVVLASDEADRTAPFSDRELEVLRAARTGASVNQVAAQAHLAPGTVRNYLSAAMARLGSARGTRPPAAPGGAGLELTAAAQDQSGRCGNCRGGGRRPRPRKNSAAVPRPKMKPPTCAQ
jgi:DNA-binding CsgD family transcriptional regulator